jgi:hypothetical protein
MSSKEHFARRAEEIATAIMAADITTDSTITLIYRIEDHRGQLLSELSREILSHRPNPTERDAQRQALELMREVADLSEQQAAELKQSIQMGMGRTVSKEGYAALARHMVRDTTVGFQQPTPESPRLQIVDVRVEITNLGPLPYLEKLA